MNNYLLPNNSTKLEKRLSTLFADLSALPVPIDALWSAENCPANMLAYLAWAVAVDEWDEEWSDERKRAVILDSIVVHKHKGTLSAIRRVMRNAGFGEVDIIESATVKSYNGELTFDGSETFDNQSLHWAEYQIILHTPITVAESQQVRRLLAEYAPARSHLRSFKFEQASHRYNGEITFDGGYTFGEV